MTDEEMRVKIAEACGWQVSRADWSQPMGYLNGQRSCLVIPDYLNDLNAMHEAEKTLTVEERKSYCHQLCEVQIKDGLVSPIFATARQRALAFIKTISS